MPNRYSRGRFVGKIATDKRWSEREQERALWAVRQCEMWARMKPVELKPVGYIGQGTDEQIDEAVSAALKYVRQQWVSDAGFGFITWWVVFWVIKLVVTLWIKEMFSNPAAYRAVMEG